MSVRSERFPNAAAEDPIVAAVDLTKVYRKHDGLLKAIENITFDVHRSEIIAVVGPSGCGKTTLLKLLANLATPTSGSVTWTDGVIPKTSFVFQKPLLLPWRTVEENVMLPFELRRDASIETARQRTAELLDSLGVGEFNKAYPKDLSGGMEQRISLARALVDDPQVVFLDEPLSAVDELKRETLWPEFRNLWKSRNVAALWVTHSVREAAFLADRILVMSPSPGTISHSVPTTLPPTRDFKTLFSDAFFDLTKAIRHALETQHSK